MAKGRGIGANFERLAADYLQQAGLKLIATNYCCRAGEIDLIMLDREIWIFVEVRYRQNSICGGAAESVNSVKQRKIIRAAAHYLQSHQLSHRVACRFDVLAITGGDPYAMVWYPDAFWANW